MNSTRLAAGCYSRNLDLHARWIAHSLPIAGVLLGTEMSRKWLHLVDRDQSIVRRFDDVASRSPSGYTVRPSIGERMLVNSNLQTVTAHRGLVGHNRCFSAWNAASDFSYRHGKRSSFEQFFLALKFQLARFIAPGPASDRLVAWFNAPCAGRDRW